MKFRRHQKVKKVENPQNADGMRGRGRQKEMGNRGSESREEKNLLKTRVLQVRGNTAGGTAEGVPFRVEQQGEKTTTFTRGTNLSKREEGRDQARKKHKEFSGGRRKGGEPGEMARRVG